MISRVIIKYLQVWWRRRVGWLSTCVGRRGFHRGGNDQTLESSLCKGNRMCRQWGSETRLRVWEQPGGPVVKNLPANAGDPGEWDSIPGWGRSPGEGNDNPLQYSCLGNPMDRRAWWATVHGTPAHVSALPYKGESKECTCIPRGS